MLQKILPGLLLVLTLTCQNSQACVISNSWGKSTENLSDPLFLLLKGLPTCPSTLMDFRQHIAARGGHFTTAMVANRGFHNPNLGSFSFFETVEAKPNATWPLGIKNSEFYFGHFTTVINDSELGLDQDPNSTSLMIELIAWDPKAQWFNFYELIGSPTGSLWFYRGSSGDIWADTSLLHLERTLKQPVFGERLRCSGCHLSGGPIMKELTEPYDSWWTRGRPLHLGGKKPNQPMAEIMKSLQHPSFLANTVAEGVHKILRAKTFDNKIQASPQIALRPLFCTEEINLTSSFQTYFGNERHLKMSSQWLVDPRLTHNPSLTSLRSDYFWALTQLQSRFPETEMTDGDHLWNAPIKSFADQSSIDELLKKNLIDPEFVADVLAIDFTRPVFSQNRCGLLKLVPKFWSSDWKNQFVVNLQRSQSPSAAELALNIMRPERNLQWHQTNAFHFLQSCQYQIAQAKGVLSLIKVLGQSRKEVMASEISQNPRGQILEPGFRVIFPEFNPISEPWNKTLNLNCL